MFYYVNQKEVFMHNYFINKNKKSERYLEVHRKGCRHLTLPVSKDYVLVGFFPSYYVALTEAFKTYPDLKQCPSCIDFHKRQNIGR
jgi:hypothetical protein